MRNLFLSMGIAVLIAGMASCGSKKQETAKTAPDWVGVYAGTTPCADCSGIQTTLTLKDEDSSYVLETVYLDKLDTVFRIDGHYSWNETNNIITLGNVKEGSCSTQYLVGDATLTQLDLEGNVIEDEFAAMYVLHKVE